MVKKKISATAVALFKIIKFASRNFFKSNKSMKKSYLNLFAMLVVVSLFSCKKDVSPKLVVTVVNEQDVPSFAWVEVSVDRSAQGVINPDVLDSAKTNVQGKVFFEFKNSVLVDVAIYADEFSNVKLDSTSVLLEVKRSRDKDSNVTNRKLVIRE